ncbi:MAG: hypothetical protein KKA64_00340 [Nanoarchaeota archaeon]|nr:hypothetical protein [Nanoarchaeota archaeon]
MKSKLTIPLFIINLIILITLFIQFLNAVFYEIKIGGYLEFILFMMNLVGIFAYPILTIISGVLIYTIKKSNLEGMKLSISSFVISIINIILNYSLLKGAFKYGLWS